MHIRSNVVLVTIALLCSSTQADENEISLIESLASPNREARYEAIKSISDLKTISSAVASAMFETLRSETTRLSEPAQKDKTVPQKLPKNGDETSLVRVKADPDLFIGKPFYIVGRANLADYWNYQYRNAETTHYSIAFQEADGANERAYLYLEREKGRAFADQLAKNAENGIPSTPLRAKVTLVSGGSRAPDQWDMLELMDIQLLSEDQKKWDPSAFEGILMIVNELKRCDKSAVPAFVEVLLAPPGTGTEQAFQSLALVTVSRMNKTAKSAALTSLKRAERVSKIKDEKARIAKMVAFIDAAGKPKRRDLD
ncbi:MAG TPA: hypothetical protein VGN12_27385 [Pirellulales bacterium]|jgi:hypothetical protein